MEVYSRRQFLQLVGVAVLGANVSLNGLFDALAAIPTSLSYGRALRSLVVRNSPAINAPPIHRLWPDSVVRIVESSGEWYRLDAGYVPRTEVQPTTPYIPSNDLPLPETPFWAEVAAPVAIVRQWASADAPLVARIGHGGVARVVDALSGQKDAPLWYGIADAGGALLGWTQAVHWRPINDMTPRLAVTVLRIDLRAHRLTALENGQPVLHAPIATGEPLQPGVYTVKSRQVGGVGCHRTGCIEVYEGVPWQLAFGDSYSLSGVYWHNQFGKPAPGPSIQVTPMLARWLYGWLGEGSPIVIA